MKIIVIGCGRVGAGLARDLEARHRTVAVVDTDPGVFDRLGPTFRGARIGGSGMDRRVLERAGIEHADGLAAVTGADEVNAVVARLASRVFRVPRVVARLYDERAAELYQRLGIQAISPVAWGIHRLGDLLTFSEVSPVATLGGGAVEVVESRVPATLAGRLAAELQVPGEVDVIAVTRHGATTLATAGTEFEEGDVVHLAVNSASKERLEALLGRPEGVFQ
ncbi:MAG TPA: TrkA family potassium uptake protein [Acidimicrobiales bacterium]|nr:TrkA family potassium uptake protein [Acidimicrobiales bacterium]